MLIYGQNYMKVGLLTNYKVQAAKPQIKEYQNPNKYITIGSGYQNRVKYDFEDTKAKDHHDF